MKSTSDRAESDPAPLALDRHPLLFGCGAAKTGTHSLTALFAREYRALHEPEADDLCHLIVDLETGLATRSEALAYLRAKDERYAAHVDVSQLNADIVELLVALYPTSRFVLTVREPYGWLDSYYDHHLSRGGGTFAGHAGGWRRLTDHRRSPDARHGTAEAEIAARGFAPIAPRLAAWSRQIERVSEAVPTERLLVLRTDRIASSLHQLAAFAGVPVTTLDGAAGHAFTGARRFGLLATVDRTYLDDLVQEHCQPHLDRVFGDLTPAPAEG